MKKNHLVYLLLGSNIHSKQNLCLACYFIQKYCHILNYSRIYESLPAKPSLTPVQNNFLNAVLLIETERSLVDLKREVCLKIESDLGRVRTFDKNAPRTIDVDILLYDNLVTQEPLRVPDPDILHYPHIFLPLSEIASFEKHPETYQSFSEIAKLKESGDKIWVLDNFSLVNFIENPYANLN